MQDWAHTIDPAIERLVEETIRESLRELHPKSVAVRAGVDHDGDQVIYVDVDYDLNDLDVDPRVTVGLTSALRDRLWERGERRFPHVRHNFDAQQKVKLSRGRRP